MWIKLMKSTFYNEKETKDKLCEFIKTSPILSMNKYCLAFEEKFANWQWRKYCVFFNSGSSANLALIQSLLNLGELKKWDKILFSSLTRATNVMPIIQLGLVPVPVDVEMNTLNISLQKIKEIVEKEKIKALFITNLLWYCDDIDEIEKYCKENDILFLEDNCESLGTVYKWKKLGNWSFASTFSTFVGHHMSTIEWWMVCTDDKDLYNMLCMTRAHGWDRNVLEDKQKELRQKYNTTNFYANYTFYTLWYNLRPSDIQWFIGCEQIQYLDEIVEWRQKNYKLFVDKINNNDDFYSLKYEHIDLISSFALPVVCKNKDILNRYIKKFEEKEVEIRPIVWWDMTQQIFWKNIYGKFERDTNSKFIHQNGFYFGNSPEYTQEEIDLLLSLLEK